MPDRRDFTPSGWTVDTLKAHVDSMLDAAAAMTAQRFSDEDKAVQAALVAQEKAVAAALAAADRAVSKAELAAGARFDSVNEFRAALTDQTATFIPRAECEQRIATNAEKIDVLAARLDKQEGRSGGLNAGWAIVGSVVLVVSAVVTTYIAIHP